MTTDARLLIMFVGVPGSGKTTFARQLAQKIAAVHINSDSIRMSMWGSLEEIQRTHTDKDERAFANKLTFGALDYAAGRVIAAGHNVVYDCNANGIEERTKMQTVAKNNGGIAVVVRIETSIETAIERNQLRDETHDQRKMTHAKSREVVARFAKEIEEPTSAENVIRISGEIPFDEQYQLFEDTVRTFA